MAWGTPNDKAGSLSEDDILRLSKECLQDKNFMKQFQEAIEDEDIPDPAKDREGHMAFIKRVQERLAENALKNMGNTSQVFEDKENRWVYTLPEPAFCIKATDTSGRKKIFINICKSPAIAEPVPMSAAEADGSGIENEELQFRVPISIGPQRVDKDKAGRPAVVYDIAVNPMTLDKCEKDYEFKRLVCALCLYGLKQKHEPDLNADEYKKPNIKCKGTPVVQRVKVAQKEKNPFDNEIAMPGEQGKGDGSLGQDKPLIEVVGEKAPVSREPGSGTAAFYSSTMEALREDEPLPDAPDHQFHPSSAAVPPPPREEPKNYQIDDDGEYDWSAHALPSKNAYWQSRAHIPARFKVTVQVPPEAGNIDVDVDTISLRVLGEDQSGSPVAEVPFRCPIDPDSVKAKFLRKKRVLTVEVTVKLPDEQQQEKERKEATRREEEEEEAEERRKREKLEAEREEARARIERRQKEEQEQQDFNRQLVETVKSMQAGELPPDMKKMLDDMKQEEMKALLARLTEGRKRGDNVDQLFEKLPKEVIESMVDYLRDKLGLAPRKEKVEKDARREAVKAKDTKEEAEEEMGWGSDKLTEKLFGVKLQNRYVFGLDM